MSYHTEKSLKIYTLSQLEQNILVGSLLGDGSLALYGRSKNAHYREQGCYAQAEYRKWKCIMLSRLDLKYKEYRYYVKLYSYSNNLFTTLYDLFYINGRKVITENNIKLLNHPIGLATVFMDDGTLVIDSTKRKNNSIHIFPRIAIYTLCFSEKENIILRNHISNTFNVSFKLKKRTDGCNYILELNKKSEILNFLDIVSVYIKEVPSMDYKLNVYDRLQEKKKALINSNNYANVSCTSLNYENNNYTKEEEELLILLSKDRIPQKEISKILNRSYYSVVDKVRRMKMKGFIL